MNTLLNWDDWDTPHIGLGCVRIILLTGLCSSPLDILFQVFSYLVAVAAPVLCFAFRLYHFWYRVSFLLFGIHGDRTGIYSWVVTWLLSLFCFSLSKLYCTNIM